MVGVACVVFTTFHEDFWFDVSLRVLNFQRSHFKNAFRCLCYVLLKCFYWTDEHAFFFFFPFFFIAQHLLLPDLSPLLEQTHAPCSWGQSNTLPKRQTNEKSLRLDAEMPLARIPVLTAWVARSNGTIPRMTANGLLLLKEPLPCRFKTHPVSGVHSCRWLQIGPLQSTQTWHFMMEPPPQRMCLVDFFFFLCYLHFAPFFYKRSWWALATMLVWTWPPTRVSFMWRPEAQPAWWHMPWSSSTPWRPRTRLLSTTATARSALAPVCFALASPQATNSLCFVWLNGCSRLLHDEWSRLCPDVPHRCELLDQVRCHRFSSCVHRPTTSADFVAAAVICSQRQKRIGRNDLWWCGIIIFVFRQGCTVLVEGRLRELPRFWGTCTAKGPSKPLLVQLEPESQQLYRGLWLLPL